MMKVISPSNCENEPYKLVCLNQVLDNFTPKIIFLSCHFLTLQEGALNPAGRSCQGDSGGYGGIRENGVATIYGVTSFGPIDNSGLCQQPSAYTDVYAYLGWMNDIMKNN